MAEWAEPASAAGREAAVVIRGVSKRFVTSGRGLLRRRAVTAKVALHALDLDVAAHGVTGIVGVNGSGKSTLIRILATLIVPDTGTVRIFGHDIVSEAHLVRPHINRVSVDAAFFKMLSPWENLLYAARLYGVAEGARSRTEEIVARLGLPRASLDRPLRELSRGQQQKVAIARSFMTSPSLLLMDEPTTGLDPYSKREVQDFVRALRRERDVTVVVCTHDLAEAEALCERVVVLDGGRPVADGTPPELLHRYGQANLESVFLAITGRRIEDDPTEEGAA